MAITRVNKKSIEKELATKNPDISEMKWIPSQFVGYEFNKIFVRRLKMKEVKLMSKLGNEPSLEMIVLAHKDAIIDVDITDLYPVDFKFMLFFIAKLTKSDFSINGVYNCPNPECKKHSEESIVNTFTLEDIDWEEMPEFPVKIEDISLKPVRIKDLLFLDEISDKFKSDMGEEMDVDISFLAVMSDYGISDNNLYDQFLKQYDLINEKPWDDRFISTVNDLYPDINPISTKCPECGTEFDLDFDLDYSKIYL